MGSGKRINRKFVLVFQPFVGLFGEPEMILSLTTNMEQKNCRLSDELLTQFSSGFRSSLWTSGKLWLLDATGC
jgi:hypothetical protein